MHFMIQRFFKHLLLPAWRTKQLLPASAMKNIEAVISDAEKYHSGEICFAVEAALDTRALWHNITAKQRAIDIFSQLRVWDTAQNNGILIYLLLADRDVEIIADRGINACVDHQVWQLICQRMENQFHIGHFEEGVVFGINEVSKQLVQYFPANALNHNELPNQPSVI